MNELSVFYVVRNEEALISQSIESILPIASEIIVVDTGSVDKTIQICSRLPNTSVHSYAWSDDFSQARNYAMRLCHGPWVMFLDADERIDERARGAIKQEITSGVGAAALRVVDHVGKWTSEGQPSFYDSPQIRLFQKDERVYFTGRVMESMSPSIQKANISVNLLDAEIHHFLWRGKNAEYAAGKLRYYNKLGANFSLLNVQQDRELIMPEEDPKPLADVAIVMTAFGALDYTRQAISSISSNAQIPYTLYLVDNGSKDATFDYFKSIKDAKVIRLGENEGVAKGKNAGLQEALKNESLQYIVFVDNDVIMPERWLSKMRQIMDANPNIGVLSPVSRLALMQSQHPDSIAKYLMRVSLAELNNTGFGRPVDFEQTDLVEGTCMMVRASLAKKIGMFDESFGLYGSEDYDYCLRARKEGCQVGRAARVFFEHFGGASKRTIGLDWFSISTTSRLRFDEKWKPKVNVGPSPVVPIGSKLGSPLPSMEPSENRKISIVIIAHNRIDMTKDCLTSIRASTKSYELVFVDNGSTDGTPNWVAKNFPEAKLITNEKNLGIPKARNQGIKETTCDLIVMMDNDCTVSLGWVEDLYAPLANGASVSGIEAWFLGHDKMPTGRAMSQTNNFGYLGGACCMFRRELFEQVGLLDEGYSPAYYEDSLSGDRCVPIRRNGCVEVVSLEELFAFGEKTVRKDGKEQSILRGVETLTVDPQNPSVEIDPDNPPSWWTNRYLSKNERSHLDKHCHGENTRYFVDVVKSRIRKRIQRYYNEDARAFWAPIGTVIRHKCNKNMFRIDGKFGQTCCTEDHSIMIWDKGHLSEATPLELADKRPCSVSCKVETDLKSYCTLPVRGQWGKEGSDAVLCSRDTEYRLPTYNGVVGFSYDDYRARDIFRFLGYYVSEGSCSGDNVSLSVYDNELAKRISDTATSFFGKEMKIHEYPVEDTKREIRDVKFNIKKTTCYRVNFYKKQIADMLLEICGKGAHGKKIPSFVYSAPEFLKREFLVGMIEGDGHYFMGLCKSERSYSSEYRLKAFKYETVSPVLASGLCLLMATMDERFSVQFNEEKGSYSVNYVQFRKNSRQKIKVTPLGKTNDFVYDISVEGTHTFVDALGLLVVHNTDWCLRAKKMGHVLAHRPTSKIKHREHATLIGTQKDFHYQHALNASGERYAAVQRGDVKPTYEFLPKRQKKLRLLYLGMQWDYGDRNRGTSFEHDNFYPSLMSWDKVSQFKYFDFVEFANQHGIAKMSEALKKTVDEFQPDAMFSVFFEPNHDPTKSVIKSITETTPCKTINWFCDSHYRYENFDTQWAPHLSYCVTTSEVAYKRYKHDGFANKVIKSQWFASPSYRKIEGMAKDVGVSFVGQPHGDRRNVIQFLLTQGVKCDCYGHGWGKRLSFSEMVEMFNRTKVNLNLNNAADARFKQIKGRNFEVPGCGGFLLTGNSENLADYYVPGREIVIFEGNHDLSEKVKHYLSNDEERERIAEAGYKRTMREHTAAHRLDAIFSKAGLL